MGKAIFGAFVISIFILSLIVLSISITHSNRFPVDRSNKHMEDSDYKYNSLINVSQVKIMTYNIKESGVNPNWIEVVKEENPDISILVETGDWDDNNNQKLQEVIEELNSYFFNEIPYVGYTDQNVPFNTMGIAILSRLEVINFKEIITLTLDNKQSYNPTHDFIEAKVQLGDIEFYIIGAHLKCCSGSSNQNRREFEMEGIINYMDTLGEVPIVFNGDFNSYSPQDTDDPNLAPKGSGLGNEPLKMLLNNNHIHSSSLHNWTDAFRLLNPTNPGFTFGKISRIDYLFVNDPLLDYISSSTVGDTSSALFGSDHLSVDVILNFDLEINPDNSTTINTSDFSSISNSVGSMSNSDSVIHPASDNVTGLEFSDTLLIILISSLLLITIRRLSNKLGKY